MVRTPCITSLQAGCILWGSVTALCTNDSSGTNGRRRSWRCQFGSGDCETAITCPPPKSWLLYRHPSFKPSNRSSRTNHFEPIAQSHPSNRPANHQVEPNAKAAHPQTLEVPWVVRRTEFQFTTSTCTELGVGVPKLGVGPWSGSGRKAGQIPYKIEESKAPTNPQNGP